MQPPGNYIPTRLADQGDGGASLRRAREAAGLPRGRPRCISTFARSSRATERRRPHHRAAHERQAALRSPLASGDDRRGEASTDVGSARGDLDGRGEWQLKQDGEWVVVKYDWTVRATKPWMIVLAPVLNPCSSGITGGRCSGASRGCSANLRGGGKRQQGGERRALRARLGCRDRAHRRDRDVGYRSRPPSGKPVVLKVVKEQGDEWRCGEIAAKFGGRGVVEVYEQMAGAALFERLDPGEALAALTLAGRDDEATDILAMLLGRMAPGDPPEGCPSVEQWG